MMLRNRSLNPIFATALTITTLASVLPAFAADDTPGGQIHFRLGMAGYSITGVISESSVFSPDIDGEFEHFTSYRSSVYIRGNLAYNLSTTTLPYYFIGVGRRYYILGSIAPSVDTTQGAEHVSASSKFKYFVGGDIGVSVLTVKSISYLTANSGNIELGPHIGAIYQLTPSFGIEVYVGASFALGFTSIALNSLGGRGFIGGTYFY